MKFQAILCFILFNLFFVAIAGLRPLVHSATALVYVNLTESLIQPRFNSDFTPPCNRPQEDPNIFRACNASGSTRFPAMLALCKCTQCDWDLLLKCESDRAWYASEANVCTASYNCHKNCTIDDLGKAERPVHCSYIKKGSLIQIHECRCRINCLKTEVRCDENNGWVIDETLCQDLIIDDAKVEGNLTFSLKNGLYTYGCETGFILEGNLTNRCDDGLLSGEAPKCVPVAPVKLGSTEAVDESKDESESSSMSELFVALIVLLVLVVVFLLTYIIYWRYREESKAWLMRKMRRRPLPRPPMQRPGTEDHYEYIDINACAVGVGEYSTPYCPVVRSGESSGSSVSRLEVGATLRNNSTATSCTRKPDDHVPQHSPPCCVSVANEFYGEQEWRENSNDLSKNKELKTDFVRNPLKNDTYTAPKKPERKNIPRKDAATSIFLPTENDSENNGRKDVATSIFLPKTSCENDSFLNSNDSDTENITRKDVATSVLFPNNEDSDTNYDVLSHTKSDRDAIPNRIEIEPRKNPSVPFVVPHELIKFSDEFVAPLNEELNSDESVEDNNAVMNELRTSSNPAKKLNSDESTNESANQGTSLILSNPTKNFEEMDSSTIKEGDAKNSVASLESIDEETSPSTSGGNLNSTMDSNALSNTLPTDESSNEPNVRISNDLFEATVHFPNMSLLNRTMFDPDDDMKGT